MNGPGPADPTTVNKCPQQHCEFAFVGRTAAWLAAASHGP